MKKIIKLVAIALISIISFSCKNVGLGEAVDLTAPSITINTPEAMENVKQTVKIQGSAKDNIGVTSVQITVSETNQTYKLDIASGWKEKNGNSWVEYTAGNFEKKDNIIEFTLYIEIINPESGKNYTIISQAFDDMGNEGKQSKDERSVIVDINPPAVTINEPTKLYKTIAEVNQSYDSLSLNNSADLLYLYNQSVEISGTQKEDSKLDNLVVYIDTETSDVVPENETEINYIVKKEVGNKRNWNFTLEQKDIPQEFQTGKHLFRIITFSYDKAGNVEKKLQGFFVYWNEADTPWITATFGESFKENITQKTYPSCLLTGTAFDDDGLKEIKINTYLIKEDSSKVKVDDRSKVIKDELSDSPTYYTWQTNAIAEIGYFCVEISCVDINGKESSVETRYLCVEDVIPPTIKITSNQNLPLDNSLFKIAGTVVDDGGVQKVLLVHKTESVKQHETEYLNGFDKTSTDETKLWNLNSTGIDKYGNKVWVLDFTMLGEKKNTGNGEERTFEYSLDWEKDFAISKNDFSSNANKLTSQDFILCAIDGDNMSRIQTLTLNGDSEKPVLTIEEVLVYSSYTSEKKNDVKQKENFETTPTLQPYNRDKNNKITDKVQLRGKWSDNSLFVDEINLTWNEYTQTITVTKDSDGTWYSEPIIPPDLTTAVISANIQDLGGNVTNTNTSFYVNGSVAQFMRITSDKIDGHYKAGEEIDIYLEFTKNVEFKNGTENPYLLLSNGKKAIYTSGNGNSSKHVFSYTVENGDESSEKLDVAKIVTNGNKWYDGSINFWAKGESEIEDIDLNLAKNRSFYIDTTAPYATEITAVTSTGNYKYGSKIYLAAEFSEEIVSDFTGLKLKLNTNNYTTAVKKTGSQSVLFEYEIQPNDNVTDLTVIDVDWGTDTLLDLAGNEIDKTKIPENLTFTGINIDTKKPGKPVINIIPALSTDSAITKKISYASTSFKISFDTTDTKSSYKYTTDYKTDGTTIWTDYTGKIDLVNGEYKICAYQEDLAGNKSDNSDVIIFSVDNGYILQSATVDRPSGTYSYDEDFVFILTFRKKVTAQNAKLKLQIGSVSKELILVSGNGTNKFTFEYTSVNGDYCNASNPLKLTDFTGTFKDEFGNDISNYVKLNGEGVSTFYNSNDGNKAEILIDTTIPKVTNVELEETTLRITFDQNITKGITSENVVLAMEDKTYRAPAYFTKDEWSNYSSNSTIASYYEKTTQGCDENGKADLSEKYVLMFDYSTINTDTATTDSKVNTPLITALKNAGADKATMSVNSSDVSISEDNKSLIMNFGTKIPVKGATYNVTIPANLVQNKLNKGNASNTNKSVTYEGIEEPVIRIKKSDSTVIKNDDNTLDITLPINAAARIDCQTPGAEITYQLANSLSSGVLMDTDSNSVKMYLSSDSEMEKLSTAPSHTFDYGDSDSQTYENSSTFELSAGDDNDFKGYQVRIKATAIKNSDTATSYEQAMKTVVVFKPNNNTASGYDYRALRGGDNVYGGVSTPGFPLSWNVNETDKIQTMKEFSHNDYVENTNGQYVYINNEYVQYNNRNREHQNKQRYNYEKIIDAYYWVTWKLTTTAYVNILATDGSSYENGYPTRWWWASCGWVPDVADYPIYPGETSTLDASKQTKNGGFQYLGKHKQSSTPASE